MKTILALSFAAALAAAPLGAAADTLYQSAPPPAGAGHPLRLGPDHRASQVGDLVYIVFDLSEVNAHNDVYTAAKSAGFSLTGLFHVPAVNGATNANSNKSATGNDSFTSTMMATVTDVLPSGAMAIAGDQGVVINGRRQVLHITGFIRPDDLDFTDAVVASRVANVQATFYGDDVKHRGLIQQILNFLF